MAATVAAAAPAQAAQTPAPESISGSGSVAATHYSISVDAGPFGQDPSGTLSVNGFFTFDATLTCVNEVGQDGVAGFRVNDGPWAGQGFLTASQSAGGVGPGAILYSGTLPTPPANCPPPGSPPPPVLANQGGGGTVQGTLVHTGGPDHPLPFQQLTFPTPAPAGAVTQASDGTLWFAEPGAGRIATAPDDESGTVTEYDVPQGGSVSAIAPDSTGGVWFTEPSTDAVGHVDATGRFATYPVPGGAPPSAIAAGANGGAWFTEPGRNAIARIDASGDITATTIPTAGANPAGIAPAGDGGAWFTESGSGRLGRVTPSGAIEEFAPATPSSRPTQIAGDGLSGAWFLESATGQVGHVDRSGDVTEYPLPSDVGAVQTLASGPGPDGSAGGAWFSEPASGRIGFISATGAVDQYTLPGAVPGDLTVTPTLLAAPLSGYDDSEAVWWTDGATGGLGLARFPAVGGGSGPLPPQVSLFGAVSVSAAHRVTVRRSLVSLTVRCAGLVSCTGDATLRHQVRGPHAPPVMASLRFRVRAARSSVLHLHLNGKGRSLVAAARRAGLRAGLTVRWSSYGHQFVRLMTLRPAPRRSRRG
jgi:virginiamycin B lyase